MKHLTSIEALSKPFDGYWVKSAYRIPQGRFPVIERFLSQETPANAPITEMMVNSLISHPADGGNAPLHRPTEIRGIAWDGGYRIRAVGISSDGGKSWRDAALGEDHGRFSFRPWRYPWTLRNRGTTQSSPKPPIAPGKCRSASSSSTRPAITTTSSSASA